MDRDWAETYFGAKLLCDNVDVIQRTITRYGVWEPDVSRVIERSLKPGDTFVDIGANIGYDALLGAYCVGLTGRVVAIEPNPKTFTQLVANLKANLLGCVVRSVPVAVSDRPGMVQLYELDGTNTGATTTNPYRMMWPNGDRSQAHTGVPVGAASALPLEQILTPEERQHTRLIKIDVEGAEGPIMWDLLDHLDQWRKDLEIVVEIDPDQADWQALLFDYAEQGYHPYLIDNDYTTARYQTWTEPTPLRRLQETPEEQCDLLLTRRM
jgi:FkbM family methyltransferase